MNKVTVLALIIGIFGFVQSSYGATDYTITINDQTELGLAYYWGCPESGTAMQNCIKAEIASEVEGWSGAGHVDNSQSSARSTAKANFDANKSISVGRQVR